MFIYKITNTQNNKLYIGLTTEKSIEERFRKHLVEARCTNKNRYFLRALRKYGASGFNLELIDQASSLKELKQKEIHYIALYNTTNRSIGYNLSRGGEGTPGVLKSEETRNKIRQKALGRMLSQETKNKMSKSHKGKKVNQKTLDAIARYNASTSKAIDKYDLSLNLLESYSSITSAPLSNNIDRGSLIRYLNKKRFNGGKPLKGFIYKIGNNLK